MIKGKKIKYPIKFLIIAIAAPFVVLWLAFCLLYLPPVQKYATQKITEAIASNSNFTLTIGSVGLSFPFKLVIEDFTLLTEGDTIASGKEVAAGVSLLPLLYGEIEVDYLSLEDAKVDTRKLLPHTHIKGTIGNFRTVARNIDLAGEKAKIKQLYLRDSNISIEIEESDTPQEESSTTAWCIELQKGNIENLRLAIALPHDTTRIAAQLGKFTLKKARADIGENAYGIEELRVDKSSVAYDNDTQPREEAPTKHITLNNITLQGNDIYYSHPEYAAKIKKLSFAQEGGITITDGKLIATTDGESIKITQAEIKSKNGTHISLEALLPTKTTAGKKSKINGNINACINKNDLNGFITTAQAETLATLPDSLLNAQISIHGTPDDINVERSTIAVPTVGQININGNAKNITDEKKRSATITLDGEITNINKLVAPRDSTTITPLNIKGNARLDKKVCNATLALDGKGEAALTASYNLATNAYDTKLETNALNLQASLPFVPCASLTAKAVLSGRGTDIFSPQTYYQLIAEIDTISYSNTRLKDITISAFQANTLSLIALNSYNPDANLSIVANNHIEPHSITTATKLDIKNIDLEATGLHHTPFTGKGSINIEAETNLGQTHKLKLTGNNITINTPAKQYTPAPLHIELATSPAHTSIEALNGDLSIKGTLASGYVELMKQSKKLQSMLIEAKAKESTTYHISDLIKEIPAINLDINCGHSNLLTNLLAINGIELSDAKIICSLDSTQGLYIDSEATNIATTNVKADTIYIKATQQENNIKYQAGANKKARSEQDKQQFVAAIYGNLHQDTLNTNLTLTGNKEENHTHISITTYIEPQKLGIHISPDITFLGTPIKINRDNHITIGKNQTISANLKATDTEGAGLHLYTINDSTAKHDVTLELYNINLKKLTSNLPFAPELTGTLNSDIRYRNDKQGEMFSCDVRGESLTYNDNNIGNNSAELVYLPKKNGTHHLSLLMSHNNNEILNLWGDYNNEEHSIKGNTTITNFPLEIANAFIKENGLKINGTIDGDLTLDGDITKPHSEGYIKFDSVAIDAPLLGSSLNLVNEKVEITDSKMRFNNLNIYAKNHTPFNINGNIDIREITNPVFDLKMRAKNYTLVNAPRQKNSILYGNLNININSHIKGPANALKILGETTILGNTSITYVMPENSIVNDNEFDGLVEFVNFQDTTTIKPVKEIPQMGNVTMSITLDIEESAWINADISPDRSSYISLQGGGKLNMNYNNEEGLTLTGRYTLNNGDMKYSLPIIPLKTFNISRGSYIYWTGEALNPSLNITALERVVTPVNIDGAGSIPVTFDVGLVLSNSLDDMGLNFTMQAPENAIIQDELNSLDAETMNKYAVTMLITGAYVGSKGSLTVSNALTSFLDSKINDIAGDAMKNVSINVGIADVENSETGGSYMNYSFSFAKRFWNDRLTIIVGGEVNSGDSPESNQDFINNVSLEWKISNNGNRYLRLFYDKNYESILEGEITETGVGYIYKRKLGSLDELLDFKKKQ